MNVVVAIFLYVACLLIVFRLLSDFYLVPCSYLTDRRSFVAWSLYVLLQEVKGS